MYEYIIEKGKKITIQCVKRSKRVKICENIDLKSCYLNIDIGYENHVLLIKSVYTKRIMLEHFFSISTP